MTLQMLEIRLLAVDEDQARLACLTALLTDVFPAARVLSATSGARALELAVAEDPDAILVNGTIAGMDIFEVCRSLKADARTKDIPIIFVAAGQTERLNLIRALEVGTEAFLRTPIDKVELEAAVRAMAKLKALSMVEDLQAENEARKKTESQKMEAIGRLAGGVAHDFNNLLSVILNYTEFVLEDLREGDPMRDDLIEVQKAGDRATSLTRQLLAFSRKQILQPMPIDLNRTTAEMEKMLRRILGEDIDFVDVLAEDLGVVRADPGQIQQVLMNLVVNARDAMPTGGKLHIETCNVEIGADFAASHLAITPGSYIQLVVSDTGSGMDEQTKMRLFEPFFTTKKKGKGTGLGLSTVYGIVRQSGGDIRVRSELGRGTTFTIYLPRDLTATVAFNEAAPVTRDFSGTETILVVEDEEALREVARRSLAAAGYAVLTAASGHEALQISATHDGQIHLLLTDVVMPQMGGRVLAQELVKTRPAIEVIYMSGYTDDAIGNQGVLDADAHFLGKPLTGAHLSRKVRAVLDAPAAIAAMKARGIVEASSEQMRPLDFEVLGEFPADVLGRLRKAVVSARCDEIIEVVETMAAINPNVAARLRQMADAFDYEGMRYLLGEAGETPNGS